MIVWHMYTRSEDLGRTTIGIFEDAEKGLQFIRSFGFKQEIYFSRKGLTYTQNNMYTLEFTSKEAIENGFLDMYKSCFLEKRVMKEAVRTLCLEEVELNKQLSFTLEEED
ncbi:hypothetical protein MFLAVUS_010997 [Mucor flavus]|uniref:Uncharacterized protein n=1 Tax=Mucor flavus TaxID=439312 RepID=A0ABP9ZEA4_9FUNG